MEGTYLGEAGRSAGRVSEVKNSGLRPRELLQEKRSEAEERNATDGFYVYRTYIFLLVLFAAFAERNLKCRKFRRDVPVGTGVFLYRQAGVCVRPVIHASGKQGFCIAEWVVRIAAVAVCLLLAVSAVRIAAAGYKKAPDPATPVIVLGCKVKGTRPSRILQERLDAADAYLSTHPEASCVLSGGQGADEEISEASCMYAYLREKGIEENRLILEDRSVSTAENMAFSRQIFEARGMGEKAVIITSEFHEYRARMLAEACGFTTYAYGASTDLLYFPTYFLREVLGVSYYTVRDVVTPGK